MRFKMIRIAALAIFGVAAVLVAVGLLQGGMR